MQQLRRRCEREAAAFLNLFGRNWVQLGTSFHTGALCCGQHVMLSYHTCTCLPTNLGLITIARLASQTRTEITCRPSVPPSAPYDDVAAVPTSSSSSLFPPSARTCCRRRRRRTCAVLANGGVAVVAERPMGARLGPKMKAVA